MYPTGTVSKWWDTWTVDADAVDDPCIPPLGNGRGQASNPACRVDRAIHNIGIEPRGRFAESHHAETDVSQLAASGKDEVVALVDVILIQQYVVDGRSGGGDGLGITFVGVRVGATRHVIAEARCGHR